MWIYRGVRVVDGQVESKEEMSEHGDTASHEGCGRGSRRSRHRFEHNSGRGEIHYALKAWRKGGRTEGETVGPQRVSDRRGRKRTWRLVLLLLSSESSKVSLHTHTLIYNVSHGSNLMAISGPIPPVTPEQRAARAARFRTGAGHGASPAPQNGASQTPQSGVSHQTPQNGASQLLTLPSLCPRKTISNAPSSAGRMPLTPISALSRPSKPLCATSRRALKQGHRTRGPDLSFGNSDRKSTLSLHPRRRRRPRRTVRGNLRFPCTNTTRAWPLNTEMRPKSHVVWLS